MLEEDIEPTIICAIHGELLVFPTFNKAVNTEDALHRMVALYRNDIFFYAKVLPC